jgi:hypothetical protein
MNYDSPHVLRPSPSKLWPPHTAQFDLALAGLGVQSPRPGIHLTPGIPPQSGQRALLTASVAHNHTADCPTCNLIEIPYDASLPMLR